MLFNYLKIFYLGDHYHGIAAQPNLKTIEEELLNALIKTKYIIPSSGTSIQLSGRTDKGVHARGQVIGFLNKRDFFHPIEVNKVLPDDILIWAYSVVHNENEINEFTENSNFKLNEKDKYILNKVKNPRFNALNRNYKYFYFDYSGTLDLQKIRKTVTILRGAHDFKNFCKREKNRSTKRTMDSITFEKKGNLWVFDFTAKSFLWKQIRKTMDVILKIGRGEWPVEYAEKLLNPLEKKISAKIKPVSPSGLILWDISFPDNIKFTECEKSIFKIKFLLRERIDKLVLKKNLYKALECSF